jgi:hypothetical protein
MRATRLLESQHRQVESLIGQLRSRSAERPRLLRELADALAAHMLIEEEMFYPAASTVRGAAILQNYEEHESEVPVVQRLLATRDEEAFQARLTVLTEMIQLHVAREENDLFPQMDRALGQQQNEMLGQQMMMRFNQVMPMGHETVLMMRPIQVGIDIQHQCPQGQIGQQGSQGQAQQGQAQQGQAQQGQSQQGQAQQGQAQQGQSQQGQSQQGQTQQGQSQPSQSQQGQSQPSQSQSPQGSQAGRSGQGAPGQRAGQQKRGRKGPGRPG